MPNGIPICCGKCYPPDAGPDQDVTLDDVIEALIAVERLTNGILQVAIKLKEQQGDVNVSLS
jgi:hypothetical protein